MLFSEFFFHYGWPSLNTGERFKKLLQRTQDVVVKFGI